MATDKPWPIYGCHVDVDHGCPPDDCVINLGQPQDCFYGTTSTGRERKTPNGCEYWRRIKAARNEPAEVTAARKVLEDWQRQQEAGNAD